jgi:hypothetical protein
VSAKRINPGSIEVTDKVNGKQMDTSDWQVSSKGKVLTMTEHSGGQKRSTVPVYESAVVASECDSQSAKGPLSRRPRKSFGESVERFRDVVSYAFG